MPNGQGETPSPDPQAQARDWITIWHSELTAMATDRELVDGWARLVTLWAEAAERAARLLPGGVPDGAAGRAGPAAPPGPAAPVAAPDARDATIQRLADRVAELERRLGLLAEGNRGPRA
ncbi:MAG: hypothetical protein WDN04_20605 [Rhodospirillales bacterium]